MAAKGYTTKAKIENYMLKGIDAVFNTQIDEWIEGVERTIDQITGRNFIADSQATARVFDGKGEHNLIIDDCIELTKVERGNDGYGGSFTEILATGGSRYFSVPANHTALLVPITKIVLNSSSWVEGMQNHRITAKWGYSIAVPSDIERAATVFVAGIINQQTPGGDQIKSEKIGNYAVTYNSDNANDAFTDFQQAIATLDSYKRYYL